MKSLFSLSLLLIASVCLATEARSQACGYIYAKFNVVDGNGKFVSSARLQLLSRDGRPIAPVTEISVSSDERAFKFIHGLCGSHLNVRLVITGDAFERFESVIDLPLNSPKTEHVFTIQLSRKGTNETSSIETWGRLVGEAKDNRGHPLADVQVVFTDVSGGTIRVASSSYGIFYLVARQGKYSLEAKAPNGDKIKYEDITLAGPGVQGISLTFNTRPN